jgi:hypothetical protein
MRITYSLGLLGNMANLLKPSNLYFSSLKLYVSRHNRDWLTNDISSKGKNDASTAD